MSKKIISLFFSLVLIFSLASSSFADSESITQDKSTIDMKTVSVFDVVPQEYIDAVKGKFQSKEEVLNATGFKSEKSNITTSMMKFDSGFDNGAIIVDNLDEYAALLSYYADLGKSTNNSPLSISPSSANNTSALNNTSSSTYTDVATKTIWGDGLAFGANLSWITGSVKIKKDSSTHEYLEILETGSSLHGFHPGNSWTHVPARTSHGINSDKKTGWARIAGDRTLTIIVKGIGEITTLPESHYMSF
ncbi:hypothetical protein [Paenibacillus sp. GXUN7292]|uniref:hypothetical protein n=1 Tax=Paenibacillus sp. GXUN7292 TaxID=3422499 RepID=UPI003D7C395D